MRIVCKGFLLNSFWSNEFLHFLARFLARFDPDSPFGSIFGLESWSTFRLDFGSNSDPLFGSILARCRSRWVVLAPNWVSCNFVTPKLDFYKFLQVKWMLAVANRLKLCINLINNYLLLASPVWCCRYFTMW